MRRLKFRWLIFLLSILSCSNFKPGLRRTIINSRIENLQETIDSLLSDSLLARANVGVKVISVKTGKTLYARNAHRLFNPASNMKLLTTATSLSVLKPDYRFKTIVYGDGQLSNGIMRGSLYIKGFGDPSLTTEDLISIAKRLKRQGILRITGNLIADDTYFDNIRLGEGWMWDEKPRKYSARIGALSVNENSISIFLKPGKKAKGPLYTEFNPKTEFVLFQNYGMSGSQDSVEVDRIFAQGKNIIVVRGIISVTNPGRYYTRNLEDPPMYTATLFKECLEKEGINLDGIIQLGKLQEEEVFKLAIHYSKPLFEILYYMEKESSNFVAEQLLKTIGASVKGEPGTSKKGLEAIEEFLMTIGILPDRYKGADGSGLSRYNLISPSDIVTLLKYMYRDFELQPEYTSLLPIGGIDGTLKNRMHTIQRKVRAKTGTMRGVSCLSGYVVTSDSEVLAFSMMMNNYLGRAESIQKIQDEIVYLLATFSRKKKPRN